MAAKYPAIPEPTTDVNSLRQSIVALKEAVEMLTGQRAAASGLGVPTLLDGVNNDVAANSRDISDLQNTVGGLGGTYAKLAGHQTFTGGFNLTPYPIGIIPNPFTPDPVNGNYQYGTNHGAATWNAPANDCAMEIWVTNDATAGAITFSGYTVASGNTGDALTTTNGHKFIITIRRINGISTYLIKALQ